jgi:hypothetical protein
VPVYTYVTVTDSYGYGHQERRQVGTTQEWQNVGFTKSEWGRVDQGGGRFSYPRESTHYRRELEDADEHQTVEMWSQNEEVAYTSWEDVGPPIALPDVTVAHATFNVTYDRDIEMQLAIESTRARLLTEAQTYGTETHVYDVPEIPGLPDRLSGAVRDSDVKWLKIWGSPFGYLIWGLAFITGFQAVVECLISMTTGDCTVEYVKRMNRGTALRCGYGATDDSAVAFEVARYELKQSTEEEPSLDPGAPTGTIELSLV